MKFYACLWTDPMLLNKSHYQQSELLGQKPKEYFELIERSFNSYKNQYKDVTIFCDSSGIEYIKKYTNIPTSNLLEKKFNVSEDYSETWSLAKIFCYSDLAKKGDPFCFFDLDTIIHRKFDEEFLNAEIFCYDNLSRRLVKDWFYKEYINFLLSNKDFSNNQYILTLLKELNNLIGLESSILDTRDGKNVVEYDTLIPNCAIIGGKNLDIFNHFSTNAIKNVLDPDNRKFWIDFKRDKDMWSKACIAEQFLLGLEIIKASKNLKFKVETGMYSSIVNCCKYYNFFSGSKKTPKTITHVGGYKALILNEKFGDKFFGKKNIEEIIQLSHSL